MESVRQQKVSRLLQKELGMLFQKEFQHLSQGNIISITTVRITPDLGYAKVYVSAFPTKDPKALVENLNTNIHEISHTLNQRVKNQFRVMLELRFYHDDSMEYAQRIDELLK